MTELSILYQDEDLVAIDKPSGLLVHRSEIDRRETRFALQLVRDQIGQRVFPVHRLDKPTSGVLVFALHAAAAGKMQELFRERLVEKAYFAIVRGHTEDQATIDYPLSDKREKEEKRRHTDIRPPQDAVSRYQCMAKVELPIAVGRYPQSRYSLVRVIPETGRKHQIRRHFHSIAHPIIGDTRYGEGRHNRLFRDNFNSHRLLLWSAGISFTHPTSGELLKIETQVPKEIQPLFETFNWPLSLPTM